MRISFPLLRAKDLHTSFLIMRTHSFFTLLYVWETYARLVYTWYRNIFRMIAVLIVSFELNKKRREYDKNNIKTRQQRERDETVLLLETR